MIVRSALDVVDFDVVPTHKPVFAWLCAERAAGVWRVDGGRTGEVIRDALTAMAFRHGASVGAVPAADLAVLHGAVLAELHPECDFGRLHAFRVHAASSVAHALAAAIAGGDGRTASQESAQSAAAGLLGPIL